jgi:hypothetical protein
MSRQSFLKELHEPQASSGVLLLLLTWGEPMEVIAVTPYYIYSVDKAKNRLYVTYRGDWLNPFALCDCLRHHEEAISQLSPGFTILADWREMESLFITDIIEECHKQDISAGIGKLARVYDHPTFKEIQACSVSKRTGITAKSFYDFAAAESWLDGIHS